MRSITTALGKIRRYGAFGLGIVLVLAGLANIVEPEGGFLSVLGGGVFVLTGLFLVPPIRAGIEDRGDVEFANWMVALVVLAGFMIGGAALPTEDSNPAPGADTDESASTEDTAASPTTAPTTSAATEESVTTRTPTATPTSTATPTPSRTTTVEQASQLSATIRDADDAEPGLTVVVTANTTLERADSEDDNPGEPYFEIDVGGHTVLETDDVERQTDGEFTFHLSSSDLERVDDGERDVTVRLMDRNSVFDDEIATWSETIQYEAARTPTPTTTTTTTSVPTTTTTTATTTTTTTTTATTTTTQQESCGVDFFESALRLTVADEPSVDFDIVRVNRVGDRATMRIESSSTTTYDIAQEIGWVGGSWAGYVTADCAEDPPERLSVEIVNEANGEVAGTYYVESEWARAFANHRISEEAYIRLITETIEVND